jgi:hypothetical protein
MKKKAETVPSPALAGVAGDGRTHARHLLQGAARLSHELRAKGLEVAFVFSVIEIAIRAVKKVLGADLEFKG